MAWQYGLETEVAKHLSENYGDRAWTVCALAEATGTTWPVHGVRLSPAYPCKKPPPPAPFTSIR
jgi:glycerol-3-phosphate dehydrogenase